MATRKQISEICKQYLKESTRKKLHAKFKKKLHESTQQVPTYQYNDFKNLVKEQLSEEYLLNNLPECILHHESETKYEDGYVEEIYVDLGVERDGVGSWLFYLTGWLGPITATYKNNVAHDELGSFSDDTTYKHDTSDMSAGVNDEYNIYERLASELKIVLPSGKVVEDENTLTKIVEALVKKYFRLTPAIKQKLRKFFYNEYYDSLENWAEENAEEEEPDWDRYREMRSDD